MDVPIPPSSPAPDPRAHHPPPRSDGRLAITITYLRIEPRDWTRRGRAPEDAIDVAPVVAPTVAFYREVIGFGLMALLFYSSRHGYDEPPHTDTEGD